MLPEVFLQAALYFCSLSIKSSAPSLGTDRACAGVVLSESFYVGNSDMDKCARCLTCKHIACRQSRPPPTQLGRGVSRQGRAALPLLVAQTSELFCREFAERISLRYQTPKDVFGCAATIDASQCMERRAHVCESSTACV